MPIATLRAQLERGRRAFNDAEFFEAHELWEEVWRELQGEERMLVQGLIQIAVGLDHLRSGRPRPAARLVGKGAEKLSLCPPELRASLGVDALVRAVERRLAALA